MQKRMVSDSLPYILKPVIYDEPEWFQNENANKILEKLNSDFQVSVTSGDTSKSRTIINSILSKLEEKNIDSLVLSQTLCIMLVYIIYLQEKMRKQLSILLLSSVVRERLELADEIYAKCLYNLE